MASKTYLYFDALSKDTDLETALTSLVEATSFDEDTARRFLERDVAVAAPDNDAAEVITQTLASQGVHVSYQHNAIPPSVYLREIYDRLDRIDDQIDAISEFLAGMPTAEDNLAHMTGMFSDLSVVLRKDVRRSLLSLFDEDEVTAEPEEFDGGQTLGSDPNIDDAEELEEPEELDGGQTLGSDPNIDEAEELEEPEELDGGQTHGSDPNIEVAEEADDLADFDDIEEFDQEQDSPEETPPWEEEQK